MGRRAYIDPRLGFAINDVLAADYFGELLAATNPKQSALDAFADGLIWRVSIAQETLASGLFHRSRAPVLDEPCGGETGGPRRDLGSSREAPNRPRQPRPMRWNP